MTATLGAGVVNGYLILQYAKLIFGLLPAAASRRRGLSVQPLSERRNVAAAIFSFSLHGLAKKISVKKLSYPA